MILVLRGVAIAVLVAACSQAAALPGSEPTAPPPTTHAFIPPTALQVEPEVFGGFESEVLPEGMTLVAMVKGETTVYAGPGDPDVIATIPANTIVGTDTVLTVLEGPVGGWLRVMLPIRPNGSEGWIRVEASDLFVVESRIVVDLSDRELTIYRGDKVILTSPVAIGTSRNPTPTGQFFVTDSVTLTDPSSAWGPNALGLSARSDTITEYRGGDGIIGIHGTNRPGSIGGAASLGCVRLPNDVITEVHRLIPIGTPVTIQP